jgi:hypothetical protein
MAEKQNIEDFLLPPRPDREEVVLPSGLRAVLRPPTFDLCIRYGQLPGAVLAAAKGQSATDSAASREALIKFAHAVIAEVFIVPQFAQPVPDPKDPTKLVQPPGTYHPSRLQAADRLWVSQWADKWIFGGGAAELRKFRSGEPKAAPDAGNDS